MKKRICIISMAIAFCLTISVGVWAEEGANTVNLPSPVLSEESINGLPFADVPEDAWYYSCVQDLFNNKIINGISETKFAPSQNSTRAEFVKMIAIPGGVDIAKYNSNTKFTDVPSDAWFAPYIQWATNVGIINGKSELLFAPNDYVTREEAAAIIYRYAKNIAKQELVKTMEKVTFTDEEKFADWSQKAIEELQLGNVLNGNEGYFYPQGFATRAEIAKIISMYLLMNHQAETVKYIEEHQDEIDAEIEENQKYLEETEETNDNSGSASLSGFQSAGGFQFLDGDILYNTNAGAGIVGHIGMICGDKIFEIMPQSSGSNRPRTVYLEGHYNTDWSSLNRYDWGNTYLLRRIPEYSGGNTNCRSVSVDAAWYAKTYYIQGSGQSVTYSLAASTNSRTTAQCASILYRAYLNGAGFDYKLASNSGGGGGYYSPDYIIPATVFSNRVYNGFSAIKKF